MSGWLWSWMWVLFPAVLFGRRWVVGGVRSALETRHKRKLELQEAAARQQSALLEGGRPPQPVCGCTHHLAKHDKQGKCHEVTEAPTAWDAEHKPVRYEPRPCNCQQYVGPEPLGTIFATEIVDPS